MAKILPIASGKGGVGKSFFVTNLSIILAEMGQKVVTIDLDLGASNLHTMFGIKGTKLGIGSYIYREDLNFSKLIMPTNYKNLFFVPGDLNTIGTANLQFFTKRKLINDIKNIEADWVILDLGSGSSVHTLDFYLTSNCGILVTTSEITAALNLYTFIKNAFFRDIVRNLKKDDIIRKELIKRTKKGSLETDEQTFAQHLNYLKETFPNGAKKIDKVINNFFPKIVLNMGANERDISFGQEFSNILQKNLGVTSEFLGFLPEEPYAKQCIFERKPLYYLHKDSKWIQNCFKIVNRLLKFHDYPKSIYGEDVDSIDVIYSDMQSIYR